MALTPVKSTQLHTRHGQARFSSNIRVGVGYISDGPVQTRSSGEVDTRGSVHPVWSVSSILRSSMQVAMKNNAWVLVQAWPEVSLSPPPPLYTPRRQSGAVFISGQGPTGPRESYLSWGCAGKPGSQYTADIHDSCWARV